MKASHRVSSSRNWAGRALFGALLALLTACGGATDDDGVDKNSSTKTKGKDEDAGAQQNSAKDESEQGDDEATTDDEETSDDAPADDKPAGDDPPSADDTATPAGDDTSTDTEPVDPTKPSNTTDPADPNTDPASPCTLTSKTVSTTYCTTQETCNNDYMYSSCSDLGTGAWSCSCYNSVRSNAYELTGVNAESACGVARDLCLQGVTPTFEGEADCTTSYQTTSSTYCELQKQCSQKAEVKDGVTALSTAAYSSYCSGTEGALSCQCSGPVGTRYFQVNGADGSTACDSSLELCSSSLDPAAVSETTCTTSTSSVSGDNCTIQKSCTNNISLDGGATVEVVDSPYTSCTRSTAGNLGCYCTANGRAVSFDLQSGAVGADACEESFAICDATEAIEPSGEITCERLSQTADSSICNATLQCTQSADVGGTKIGVYGSLYTYCSLTTTGEWTCSCSSGTNSTTFTYAVGDDPWESCSAASEACRDQVEVQIAPVNSGMTAPGGIALPIANTK